MALRPLPNPAFSPGVAVADALSTGDRERLRHYAEYLDFYNGKQWPKARSGRTNLVVNYARTIVDKSVSYLLGQGINFSVPREPGPEGDARAAGAEALLYRLYEENDLDAVDVQAATNGAILGDTVYKLFWDASQKRIRIVNQDPFAFFPRWAEDDVATLLSASVVYRLSPEEVARRWGGGETGRGHARGHVHGGDTRNILPVAPSPTLLVPIVETWTPSELVIVAGDKELFRGANVYGFIPFVHIPNARPANQFWGVSDLKDLIPLNRELNERMSDMADIIRFHADPPVVFKGITEHTSLAVGPGTVWDVPEGAEVSLLEWRGQQPAVHLHLERVLRALHDVAETPKTAFGDAGRIQSGVALETELQSLIQKTLRKRAWWNAGLRRRNALALRMAELMGLGSFVPYRSKVIWAPLLPADLEADVRNNVALVEAGLRSRRTAMDRLGEESPEEEMARVEGEREVSSKQSAVSSEQ